MLTYMNKRSSKRTYCCFCHYPVLFFCVYYLYHHALAQVKYRGDCYTVQLQILVDVSIRVSPLLCLLDILFASRAAISVRMESRSLDQTVVDIKVFQVSRSLFFQKATKWPLASYGMNFPRSISTAASKLYTTQCLPGEQFSHHWFRSGFLHRLESK